MIKKRMLENTDYLLSKFLVFTFKNIVIFFYAKICKYEK